MKDTRKFELLEFVHIVIDKNDTETTPNAFINRINENYYTDPNPAWHYHCIFLEGGEHYCFEDEFVL